MKNILFSFIIGGFSGTLLMFLFFNNSNIIDTSLIVTSSNPKAKISNESLVVKTKSKIIEVDASFETDRSGIYTNSITINRKDLQYRNSLSFQSGYWIKTRMPFISIDYSYQWILFSIKAGYSFKLKKADYGLGIGIKFAF